MSIHFGFLRIEKHAVILCNLLIFSLYINIFLDSIHFYFIPPYFQINYRSSVPLVRIVIYSLFKIFIVIFIDNITGMCYSSTCHLSFHL